METSAERIARRTGVSVEDVMGLASEMNGTNVVGVINYLEKRIETMRGDESARYELDQIRRDLAALVLKCELQEIPHENR